MFLKCSIIARKDRLDGICGSDIAVHGHQELRRRHDVADEGRSGAAMEKAMENPFDLEAYFERVNWRGPTTPTYETLAGLLSAHMSHIPFENFDVLLGRGVRLDLEGLQAKLVKARRGGYCFEHSTLFAAALERLGFEPVRHAARVVVFLPASQSPRTHMFLTVSVDGARYVVDPGFGPFGSRTPIPLDSAGAPADRPTHRLVSDGKLWTMHVTRDGADTPGWVSPLDAENPVDFEMGNHFTATHPDSLFRNRIMASAVTPDGRVSIMNRDVTVLRGAEAETSQLPDRSALRALLAERFDIDLPEAETLCVPSVPEWA
jgi:N-hydroxyarylamine O-acetyltransferase